MLSDPKDGLGDLGVTVALVAAVAENGVIGAGGAIPWHVSSDMQRFKAITLDQTLIMGRLTYQSIGKPLTRRRTIVVTRAALPQLETAPSLEAALRLAPRPVFLVGGAEIYTEGLAHADTIFLTRIHAAPDGDTYFPAIDDTVFSCIWQAQGVRGPRDDHDFKNLIYKRRTPAH